MIMMERQGPLQPMMEHQGPLHLELEATYGSAGYIHPTEISLRLVDGMPNSGGTIR